jgi:hypothetical protein
LKRSDSVSGKCVSKEWRTLQAKRRLLFQRSMSDQRHFLLFHLGFGSKVKRTSLLHTVQCTRHGTRQLRSGLERQLLQMRSKVNQSERDSTHYRTVSNPNRSTRSCSPLPSPHLATHRDLMCGSLQCQFGKQSPVFKKTKEYSKTMIYTSGVEYECKVAHQQPIGAQSQSSAGAVQPTTTLDAFSPNYSDAFSWLLNSTPQAPALATENGSATNAVINGMVADGTKCGDNMICNNHTCVPIESFIEPGDCPTDNVALTCSGHGICSNLNTCVCTVGWQGTDCSLPILMESTEDYLITTTESPQNNERSILMNTVEGIMKNTTLLKEYDDNRKSLAAAHLVMILVSIVGGVFIFFALLATCYRRQSLLPQKKHFGGGSGREKLMHTLHGPLSTNGFDSEPSSRIITFGSMPSYREDKLRQQIHQQQQQFAAVAAAAAANSQNMAQGQGSRQSTPKQLPLAAGPTPAVANGTSTNAAMVGSEELELLAGVGQLNANNELTIGSEKGILKRNSSAKSLMNVLNSGVYASSANLLGSMGMLPSVDNLVNGSNVTSGDIRPSIGEPITCSAPNTSNSANVPLNTILPIPPPPPPPLIHQINQFNQQLNQKFTQQLNQQFNHQFNSVLNSQINPQLNQQIAHQMKQQLNQHLNQQLNQQINQQFNSINSNPLNASYRPQFGAPLTAPMPQTLTNAGLPFASLNQLNGFNAGNALRVHQLQQLNPLLNGGLLMPAVNSATSGPVLLNESESSSCSLNEGTMATSLEQAVDQLEQNGQQLASALLDESSAAVAAAAAAVQPRRATDDDRFDDQFELLDSAESSDQMQLLHAHKLKPSKLKKFKKRAVGKLNKSCGVAGGAGLSAHGLSQLSLNALGQLQTIGDFESCEDSNCADSENSDVDQLYVPSGRNGDVNSYLHDQSSLSELDSKCKGLNGGYHEEILEALNSARRLGIRRRSKFFV